MYLLGKNIPINIIDNQPLKMIPKYEIEEFEITISTSNTFGELRAEVNNDDNISLGDICFGDFFLVHTMDYDSFVFDNKSFELITIRLKHSIKEKKPKNKKIAYQSKTTEGNIKLEKWKEGQIHNLPKSFKYRYYNKKTNTILSYGKKFLKSTSISLKLEIVKDVFLLFNEKNNFVDGFYKTQKNIWYNIIFTEKI